MPCHPHTQASQMPVSTGKVTRFHIEVFPTFAEIAKGDRLRLTITTSDSAHLAFNSSQLASLAGGVYHVQRNSAVASVLEVPLAPESAYTSACTCAATRSPDMAPLSPGAVAPVAKTALAPTGMRPTTAASPKGWRASRSAL